MAGETKFTPGPWFVREWNTHDKTTVLVDAPEAFLKVRQIAECNEEADALLIAAAPAMLHALQSIERVAKSKGMTDADRKAALRDIAEHACAAIAKTKGA